MSSRHTRGFFGVMLVVVFALSAVVIAPASAKLTKSQKVHIRHQLRKQIKKHPKLIRNKHFIKKASLVNFSLPVTIRLRGRGPSNNAGDANTNGNYGNANPNAASVDLGPSLGTRSISLGGSLSGEVVFHDSYDGGALGNVELKLNADSGAGVPDHSLTTTSIPLLWNQQVSSGRFDANDLGAPDGGSLPLGGTSGCADMKTGGSAAAGSFLGNTAVTSPAQPTWVTFANGYKPTVGGGGLVGYPFFHDIPAALGGIPNGYLPIIPGKEGVDQVKTGDKPGDSDIIGPSSNPFPASVYPGATTPGGPPTAQDTVLRTNALNLAIAPSGVAVSQSGSGDHPSGSQDIVTGASGGQANLFGNIPGKSNSIDITASFKTKINSIIRVVDQDSYHNGLIYDTTAAGGTTSNPWPAGVFNCREIWTGYVTNYIPAVHLTGQLKVSPGLTYDGHLRIAKATVSTPSPSRFAVAACLAPEANYGAEQGGSDSTSAIPDPGTGTSHINPADLPIDSTTERPAPQHACNTFQTALVKFSGLNGTSVPLLAPAVPADGYSSPGADPSKVSVGADLSVSNVAVDVLIGDV